ncbi:hypothetical protein ACERII_11765 [Evansella sp. AB-rgal1]|uniref:hypothetical protein n=1 Tax=Evansella sp. AB-rgal1 TaxID=3242696 RepID=UPI00359E88DC
MKNEVFTVKFFIFVTGLSILAFLSTRFREPFTEPYTFSSFIIKEAGMKEADKKMGTTAKGEKDSSSSDSSDFGGGE